MKLPPINNNSTISNSFYSSNEIDTIQKGILPEAAPRIYRAIPRTIKAIKDGEANPCGPGFKSCPGSGIFGDIYICCTTDCLNEDNGKPACQGEVARKAILSVFDHPNEVQRILSYL